MRRWSDLFRYAPRLCVLGVLGLIACSDSQTSEQANGKPKIVAHGLYDGLYDLVVGHSHHILEATTEEDDARMIIHAREGKIETLDKSSAQVIESIYATKLYRHFGNEGEETPPLCRVDDQDEIKVDDAKDGLLNYGQPSEPVQCTLDRDIHVYAISWGS